MRKRPASMPRGPNPETLALAARRAERPASYASLCAELPVEEELIFTRVMARKLLHLLQQREPTLAQAFMDALSIDARATLDRTFEAMLLLFFRHRIDVVPVRKLLWSQDNLPDQFVVTRVNGDVEIVDRDRLMMLAGIAD